MNPLWGSCVSEHSRCGAARIFYVAEKPSAEIARVKSLSLWRRAIFSRGQRTLCGDCACRIALAVAPREFPTWPTNPLRRLCSLSLWRRAIFLRCRRTLCCAGRFGKVADEPSASLSPWRAPRESARPQRRTVLDWEGFGGRGPCITTFHGEVLEAF